MADYGVTENGFVLKRLDEIKANICNKLKESWGIDPSINPQSALNVIITSFADEIASAWELAQDVYYSEYPSFAEGINLDHAMELGGVKRLGQTRTRYSLACTGDDGTEILADSIVKSTTQPEKTFLCKQTAQISRENFRSITFGVIVERGTYSIEINGNMHSYINVDFNSDAATILQELYNQIDESNLEKSLDTENLVITLTDKDGLSDNAMVASENILVQEVTSNIVFESEDYGEVVLPNGTITVISTVIAGLKNVTNDIEPILGRLEETDIEARQSYIKRIFLTSNTMIESIIAEILNSVQGVESIQGYENDTNIVDEWGRPPHSVEIVAVGGSVNEIAECIYKRKATGIQSFGNKTVPIIDQFGNTHNISFTRPVELNTWVKVTLTRGKGNIPSNYTQLIKSAIIENLNADIGKTIYLQSLLSSIYNVITGVSYIDIKAAIGDEEPFEYDLLNIEAGPREIVALSTDRIEVVLNEA